MKHSDYVREVQKDPEYLEAIEALKLNFAFGDAVLRGRLNKGWSQTELAKKVGTKQANISRIESGLANPTIDLINRILKALDLEIRFIAVPSLTSSKSINFEIDSYTYRMKFWQIEKNKIGGETSISAAKIFDGDQL